MGYVLNVFMYFFSYFEAKHGTENRACVPSTLNTELYSRYSGKSFVGNRDQKVKDSRLSLTTQ